jgi:ATP-dependent exoDNAse (exonuclease V) beta subunit
VLPVPKPYGVRRVSNVEIEKSLPDAVGAYIDWLINESGWKVAERPHSVGQYVVSGFLGRRSAEREGGSRTAAPTTARGFKPSETERLVPLRARHICLLFRRFVSFDEDATRPYVQALEARGIPHLLVGGRSFHNRAEIETLRAALAAIEWPDDELSVFATLRGSLFAIGDEDLLVYRARFGGLHPFRIPKELDATSPIGSALRLLSSLHRTRNRVPVASTISALLDATRAHVGFALEHGGEQVLANVSHVAELARRYEAEGGMSFRGFLEELRAQSESGEATEAPILEEGSDGVRLMTVHKAKGLEFPVVVLVDMTAKLHRATASRYLDAERRMCAVQLAGCSPRDLLDHEQDELRRDAAEGARLAYVAATRARDLLVIPAVGDGERESWLQSLNSAIYPPMESRRQHTQALGCGEFKSKDSVLLRPDGDPASASTVCPGLHTLPGDCSIVWWDPTVLKLGAEPSLGIRKPELIGKDVASAVVESGLKTYNAWRQGRENACATGSVPTVKPSTAARYAPPQTASTGLPPVEVVELPRNSARPSGRRFGSLVHAILASVPFDAGGDLIDRLAKIHARILGCPDEELDSAAEIVQIVLAHPLLRQALDATTRGRCRREVPISCLDSSGALAEGVVDLVFQGADSWTVVDFKTDEQIRDQQSRYEQQLRIYANAIQQSTGRAASMILMRL